jgi:predicted regulator of Ras-like GTPase activity (Roadblock/LC7/MglB family)
MTFQEALAAVVNGTPGARAAVLMGADGIPVEEFCSEAEGIDLPSIAVEFQRVLAEARKVADMVDAEGAGALEELVLQTSRGQLLFRALDEEYFLVVALDRNGFLGKARYLIASLLRDIRQEL